MQTKFCKKATFQTTKILRVEQQMRNLGPMLIPLFKFEFTYMPNFVNSKFVMFGKCLRQSDIFIFPREQTNKKIVLNFTL